MVVGGDLTMPQVGFSRPIVAAPIAGLILGDVQAGLVIGVVLELFALDVLPVGASKYPDYGVGSLAGVVALANAPVILGLGLASFVGLTVAYASGKAVHLVRIANTADVVACAEQLDMGDPGTVSRLQFRGWFRDATRGVMTTAAGAGLAIVARTVIHPSARMALMSSMVAIGAGVAASAGGAVNVAGRTPGVRMYLIGVAVALLWVVLI